MSQLSVNYRATWRPPPHDRKSIEAGGKGEAALFHFFCPERGQQKGENLFTGNENSGETNHEKERIRQYFEEEAQLCGVSTANQHYNTSLLLNILLDRKISS